MPRRRNTSHLPYRWLTCLTVVLLASCAQEQTPVFTIGTGAHDGAYRSAGHALARIANENIDDDGIEFRYETSTGSIANINAIVAGDLQFGIAQADHLFQAVDGLGAWESEGPQEQLRAVFSLYVETVTLVAGKDTEIRSVEDLAGNVVDVGTSESGTHGNALDALDALSGLGPASVDRAATGSGWCAAALPG